MKLKYKVLMSIWLVLIAVCVFTFHSYAMWVVNLEGEEENTIEVACFQTTFSEGSENISLKNTYPVSSERALKELNPYVFTVTNTCDDTSPTRYMVTLNRVSSQISDSFIRVLLLDTNVDFNSLTEEQLASYVSQSKLISSFEDITSHDDIREYLNTTAYKTYLLSENDLTTNKSKTFYLYAWIDSSATQGDVGGKTYEASIDVLTYSGTGN